MAHKKAEDSVPSYSNGASLSREVLRLCAMSLESCPTCGYALSTIGNQCRHCASSFTALPSRPFDARHLLQIIAGLAALGTLAYLVFAR